MKTGILLLFLVAATTSFKLPKNESPVLISDDDRIIGGTQAYPNAYPFMVRLTTIWQNGWGGSCGASLISSQWVLTAAHCVYNLEKSMYWERVIVYLGDHYSQVTDAHEQVKEAADVIVHENYISSGSNDVALIKLQTPANINSYVKPGCLNSKSNDFIGQDATAAGWGLTSTIGNTISNVLMEATLPIVAPKNCPIINPPTMICTGFKREVGQDTVFKGDSGGPLFLSKNGFTILGVASFVTLDNSYPQKVTSAVFTKVSAHLSWIQENTKATDLCVR